MNHCLFVQWKKPTDASRFVIDGNPCVYSGTEEQIEAMDILSKVPTFKEICKNNNREDLSPSFRYSYNKNKNTIRHFVEGNFEDTDFAGRKLVYIFMTSENEPSKIVELLRDYSALLGVTPYQADLEEIEKQTSKKKDKVTNTFNKLIKWTIIVIVVLLLLYMLQNLLSR